MVLLCNKNSFWLLAFGIVAIQVARNSTKGFCLRKSNNKNKACRVRIRWKRILKISIRHCVNWFVFILYTDAHNLFSFLAYHTLELLIFGRYHELDTLCWVLFQAWWIHSIIDFGFITISRKYLRGLQTEIRITFTFFYLFILTLIKYSRENKLLSFWSVWYLSKDTARVISFLANKRWYWSGAIYFFCWQTLEEEIHHAITIEPKAFLVLNPLTALSA